MRCRLAPPNSLWSTRSLRSRQTSQQLAFIYNLSTLDLSSFRDPFARRRFSIFYMRYQRREISNCGSPR
ncbi:Uncharacterized protein HZ326_17168 [Fusarium oxysporum f. sp. albedinis]|nr:Uncharacterized protein HZ326_17168 [Fusarium oxysporum f. sp. albedinis]